MAITTGKNLLAKPDATAEEIGKSIEALKVESDYLQRVMNAGLRARELEAKLKCIN
jgi:hypothetical protein